MTKWWQKKENTGWNKQERRRRQNENVYKYLWKHTLISMFFWTFVWTAFWATEKDVFVWKKKKLCEVKISTFWKKKTFWVCTDIKHSALMIRSDVIAQFVAFFPIWHLPGRLSTHTAGCTFLFFPLHGSLFGLFLGRISTNCAAQRRQTDYMCSHCSSLVSGISFISPPSGLVDWLRHEEGDHFSNTLVWTG